MVNNCKAFHAYYQSFDGFEGMLMLVCPWWEILVGTLGCQQVSGGKLQDIEQDPSRRVHQ
jgi:hypothetical protein